ncbi:MAG: Fic family protein, partial [Chloroflexota bacterium]|nr:Fic family protein [Chloroflexota bacterium]
AAIEQAAEELREPGESPVRALSRYLETEQGRRIWREYLEAPPPGPEDLDASAPGRMVLLTDDIWAYVPDPLPPATLQLGHETRRLLGAAEAAIGELADWSRRLAAVSRNLLAPLRRRAAVLAAGAPRLSRPALLPQPSLSCGISVDGAERVAHYSQVLDRALEQLPSGPVALPLLLELHASLAGQPDGGAYRRNAGFVAEPGQRRLDRARYVGPPPHDVPAAMAAFDRFVRQEERGDLLVRLALVHYQIAAIHPFLDGNGRMARLLVTLLLRERGRLHEPILALDMTQQPSRRFYSDLLLRVSLQGRWSNWIDFFLTAAEREARSNVRRAQRLLLLWEELHQRLRHEGAGQSEIAAAGLAFRYQVVCLRDIQSELRLPLTAAQAAIDRLVRAGVLADAASDPRIPPLPADGSRPCWIAPSIVAALEET